jgi:DNA mismatch endonuclease (patch repair protein)
VADNLTPEQRRKTMQAVKGSNTSLERTLAAAFRRRGFVFECNARDILGRPDFVFRRARLLVFAHGDFWHGWRFPLWRGKLQPFWREKIERNRRRDRCNERRLRRLGWRVLHFWGHQIERDVEGVVRRVVEELAAARTGHGVSDAHRLRRRG